MRIAGPLFALSFASPALLYGLAAVSVPIVIHLLFKARKQTIIFSSIRFVLESAVRKSSRIRFKELLLLLLRIAMFAAIVLAFTKPFRQSAAERAAALGAPTDAVFVLDDSFSMAYDEAGTTRFAGAQKAALAEIHALRAGDRAALMRATPGHSVVVKLTPNFNTVARAVQEMKVSNRSSRFAEALGRAAAVLDESRAERRVIFFISDFQKCAWPGFRHALDDLPEEMVFRPMPVTRESRPNFAVLAVGTSRWGWVQGQPLQVVAKVANYSPSGRRDLSAWLNLDGRKVLERVFEIGPREIKEVQFNVGALAQRTAGSSASPSVAHKREVFGSVRISANDRLPIDDQCFFRLAATEPIRVLCVEETVSDVPYFQETYYLRTALDPSTENRPGPRLVAPKLVAVPELDKEELAAFQVIILANVSGLSEPQSQRLDQYVRWGGGLLVFLGDRTEPTIYNHRLYREGTGPLPACLGDVANTLEGEFWHIAKFDRSHFVFRPFLGRDSGDVSLPRFESVFSIDEVAPENAHSLADLDDGSPVLLEKQLGKGRVLLFASTCDAEWTNFPKKKVYLPFVHQMVRYLARREKPRRTEGTRVGEAVRLDADSLGAERALIVLGPDGKEIRISLPTVGAGPASPTGVVSFKNTRQPGIYTVRSDDSKERARHFAVHLDTVESDLAIAKREELEEIAKGKKREERLLAKTAERVRIEREGEGERDLWRALFIGALALMLFELLVANRVGA